MLRRCSKSVSTMTIAPNRKAVTRASTGISAGRSPSRIRCMPKSVAFAREGLRERAELQHDDDTGEDQQPHAGEGERPRGIATARDQLERPMPPDLDPTDLLVTLPVQHEIQTGDDDRRHQDEKSDGVCEHRPKAFATADD